MYTATLHHKKKDVIELSTSLNDIKKKMDQVCDIITEHYVATSTLIHIMQPK